MAMSSNQAARQVVQLFGRIEAIRARQELLVSQRDQASSDYLGLANRLTWLDQVWGAVLGRLHPTQARLSELEDNLSALNAELATCHIELADAFAEVNDLVRNEQCGDPDYASLVRKADVVSRLHASLTELRTHLVDLVDLKSLLNSAVADQSAGLGSVNNHRSFSNNELSKLTEQVVEHETTYRHGVAELMLVAGDEPVTARLRQLLDASPVGELLSPGNQAPNLCAKLARYLDNLGQPLGELHRLMSRLTFRRQQTLTSLQSDVLV
jgi:hypothetical protein